MVRGISKRLIKKISWKSLIGLFLLFSFVNLVKAETIIDNLDNDSSIEDQAGAADGKWEESKWGTGWPWEGSNWITVASDSIQYYSSPSSLKVMCQNTKTQNWQHFTVEKLYTGDDNVHDFSENNTLSVYVSFSGDAAQADTLGLLAKIKDSSGNESDDLGFPEVTKNAGWTKISWDYDGKTGGVDLTKIETILFFPRPVKDGSLMEWWWGDFYMDDLQIEGSPPGPPTGGITVTVVDLSGNPTDDKIMWDGPSITPGATKWLCAETLLKVECDYTGTGAIQIYTDNKEADANPQWNGTGDPKNLLRYETGISTSSVGIPLCWRVWNGLLDPYNNNDIVIVETDGHLHPPDTPFWYTWLWMADRGASGFVDGDDYVKIWEKGIGMQGAEATWYDWGNPPLFIYIGANFTDAMAQKTYKTSTLRLELFTQ